MAKIRRYEGASDVNVNPPTPGSPDTRVDPDDCLAPHPDTRVDTKPVNEADKKPAKTASSQASTPAVADNKSDTKPVKKAVSGGAAAQHRRS